MHKTQLRSVDLDSAVFTKDLTYHRESWLLDCEVRELSHHVIGLRRMLLTKLEWFLNERGIDRCGTVEIRGFLAYVRNGHESPSGRWNNPKRDKPVRPRTIRDYHAHLRAFFRWLVREGSISESPVDRIEAPIARPDQVKPFTPDQVAALLSAAKGG